MATNAGLCLVMVLEQTIRVTAVGFEVFWISSHYRHCDVTITLLAAGLLIASLINHQFMQKEKMVLAANLMIFTRLGFLTKRARTYPLSTHCPVLHAFGEQYTHCYLQLI